MSDLLTVLCESAGAVEQALAEVPDWGAPGVRPGQYAVDVVADEAAVGVLRAAGHGVLSEESGAQPGTSGITVVLDPLDGSDNAVRSIGPHGVSLCAVDAEGPVAAVVFDLTDLVWFTAVRGEGARRDGELIHPSNCRDLDTAVLAVSGHRPAAPPGRSRSWGAAALELCAVADGRFDGFVHWGVDHHGPWDYLGGAFVCEEAGAVVADAEGRDLVCLDLDQRRRPVAAATPELLEALLASDGDR
ncbi:MAG TPA: inositol monophosphatase [Acidimicrobiales bacterium]|nr:inositol monophosphatase [Acidimicrobiales bacterium]